MVPRQPNQQVGFVAVDHDSINQMLLLLPAPASIDCIHDCILRSTIDPQCATVTSASASAARGVARFVAPLTWQHVAPAGGPPGYHLLCSLSWGRLRLQSLLISLLNMLALICHSKSCLLLLLLLIMFGLGHYIDLIQPNPAPKSY